MFDRHQQLVNSGHLTLAEAAELRAVEAAQRVRTTAFRKAEVLWTGIALGMVLGVALGMSWATAQAKNRAESEAFWARSSAGGQQNP